MTAQSKRDIDKRRKSWPDRFWAKVDSSGYCWVWMGTKSHQGYGSIRIGIQNQKAHRVAFELASGIAPRELAVCHRCDNPSCVRPDHLFLGTVTENNQDRHRKGRTKNLDAGREKYHTAQRAKTHCPSGHAYDQVNTLYRSSGARDCRACGRREARTYAANNREKINARRKANRAKHRS